MADYQKAVDDIRSFLESGDLTGIDRVREAAVTYASGCHEANQRLRRCADFLQQQLYTEAIHLAQAEPPVLDLLAILDFPERERWEEIAILYEVSSPPKLRLDIAQTLNEAYAIVQPLEQLLRRHRLLALARASLPSRLSVMQEIARLDPANQLWSDDVRLFEKKRFEDLTKLINGTLERGDPEAAVPLLREFRGSQWLSEPTRPLLQAVERCTDQQNLAALKRLETGLHEAHNALDFALARKLRDQWARQLKASKLDTANPLFDRAGPALEWVAQQERREANERRFQTGLQKLMSALDANAPSEELQQLYGGLLPLGIPIPTEIEGRYQDCLAAHRRAAANRRRLVIAASACGCLLIAAILYTAVSAAMRSARKAEATRHIQSLLDNGDLVQARMALDRLTHDESGGAMDLEAADLSDRLTIAEAAEHERVTNFKKAIAAAEAAPANEVDPPALARARELARHNDEYAEVARLVDRRHNGLERAQAAANETFQKQLGEVEARIVRFERSLAGGADETADLQRLLRELKRDADDLDSEASKAGIAAQDLCKRVRSRLDNAQKSLELQVRALQEEQSVTQAVSQGVEPFAAAVQKYIAACPGTQRTQALATTVKEKGLWQRVSEWNQLISPYAAKPLEIPPADAKTLAQKCEVLLADRANFVDAPTATQYLAALKAIAQRDEADAESAAAGLRKLFADSMVGDMWILRTKNTKTYYLKENVTELVGRARLQGEGIVNVRHYVGFDGSERPHPFKTEDISETSRAPQSLLADQVKKLPKNFGGTSWERNMLEIIEELQRGKNFDPIPQLLLLKQVLDFASKGGYPLGLALKPCSESIDRANLDLTVAWIDPGIDASAVREQATETLKQIPRVDGVLAAVRKTNAELTQAIANTRCQIVGWLAQDRHNGWTCRSPSTTTGTHQLFVALPIAGSNAVEWREIGTCVEGRITIQATAAEALAEGRLVFARTPH